jgi:Fe-coproporphyrin III synthase
MLSQGRLRTNLLVKLGEVTHRTHVLPLVMLGVTERCNSRCVSCDFWKSDGAGDLTLDELERLAAALPAFGTRVVVFTGGEPLFRPDLMEVADVFRARGIRLHLLTSGLGLERFAEAVAARFVDVTVSLDGSDAQTYRRVRGVDGLAAVARGVNALRSRAPHVRLGARSTIHRHNFRDLPRIIDTARELGLPHLSFLPADVAPGSFNRRGEASPRQALLLEAAELGELSGIVEAVIGSHAADLAAGRVTPGPAGLRNLVRYYGAQLGLNPFPPVSCNAPWMSAYIAPDGAVHPCFFHPAAGNIRRQALREIFTVAMPAVRRGLDVAADPTCQRCVCNLKTGLRSRLW